MVNKIEPAEDKKQSRYLYLDVLRALASFAVVIMHCTGRVFTVDADMHWWVSMVLQALSHWAIPAFFMISGITLLNYRERYSTKSFLKKRMIRVFIPFLLWSGIYLVWRVYLQEIILESPMQVVRLLAANEINGVFWFFYVLFGMYLCIPVLSVLVEKKKVSILYFFVVIWLINVTGLPLLERFAGVTVIQGTGGITIGVATGYVGYLILGCLLHHVDMNKSARYVTYILGIIGFMLMIVGTYWLNENLAEGFDDFFMGYMSFDCILLSVAVMVFFKHIPWERIVKPGGKIEKCIKMLARASFGVYLLHMLVLQIIERNVPVDPSSYWYMTMGAIAVYVICVGITVVGQKIPVVGRLFP